MDFFNNGNQAEEIKTIRERDIKLNLSDADCSRIAKYCGMRGIPISTLLENFIGDLVNGTYTNGSDERMYANSYADRCWFSLDPSDTLLSYLLSYNNDFNMSRFIYLICNLDDEELKKEYHLVIESYKKDCKLDDINIDKEVNNVIEWYDEFETLYIK